MADRDDGLERLLQFGFEPFQARYDDFFASVGAIVMGAATYRWLARTGEPWPYAGLPSWVLTHHDLPPLAGAEGTTPFEGGAIELAYRAVASGVESDQRVRSS